MTIHCPSGMFAFSTQVDPEGEALILEKSVSPIRY